MDMEKKTSGSLLKKGMVYSLSIFLLVAVLLALMAFWVEQTDKRRNSIDAPAYEDVLAGRLEELSRLSTQALGINATLWRNSTHVRLNVSDAGFPLSAAASGMVDLGPLQSWLTSNWTAATHANLTYNYSSMNSSGQLVQTSMTRLVYSHDNSNAAYDQASLVAPVGSAVPRVIGVNITCRRPGGAASVAFGDLGANGTTVNATIFFYDSGGLHVSNAMFDTANSSSFSARYYDGTSRWMQTIHVDWVGPDALRVRGENNATYVPALGKNNVSCSWNASILETYSGAAEEKMYMPISVNLTYYNATYGGQLVMARK